MTSLNLLKSKNFSSLTNIVPLFVNSCIHFRSGQFSDSEVEDDPTSNVTLPQNLAGRGAKAGAKSALRMYELGPRIRLELVKIEEGLLDGEVLFHKFIQKTEEEKKIIRQRRETRK